MASILKVSQLQKPDGSTPTAADLGIDDSGNVIQIVQLPTSYLSVANTVTAVYYEYGSITVTPKSSTSRFMIIGQTEVETSGGNYPATRVRLMRNGNTLKSWQLIQYMGSNSFHRIGSQPVNTYDSSAHGGADVTFSIQAACDSGSSVSGTYNTKVDNYNSSEIYILEIAQ